jgi:hypothetical protein
MMQFSRNERQLVVEDPVMVSDGLCVSPSAIVQFSPEVGGSFIRAFVLMQSRGAIKLKTVRVAKVRDWMEVGK